MHTVPAAWACKGRMSQREGGAAACEKKKLNPTLDGTQKQHQWLSMLSSFATNC
jgi:hypothetical protein